MLGFPKEGIDARKDTARVYLVMTLFVDHAVGKILDALSTANLTEDTIVFFCADHGDFGGDDGSNIL